MRSIVRWTAKLRSYCESGALRSAKSLANRSRRRSILFQERVVDFGCSAFSLVVLSSTEMGFWNRSAPREATKLADFTSATDVRLEGVLFSPEVMVSPLTGRNGILFHWTIYARHWEDPSYLRGADPERIQLSNEDGYYELLDERIRAGELFLRREDGVVRIPTACLELGQDPRAKLIERLEGELPGEFREIRDRAEDRTIFFRERSFLLEAPVTLVATLHPAPQNASVYRSSGRPVEFVAQAPATLLSTE